MNSSPRARLPRTVDQSKAVVLCRHPREFGRQGGGRPFHLRAVRRDVDFDGPAEHAVACEFGHRLPHRLGIAGDHARARAVAGGDADLALATSEPLCGFASGELDDSHGALAAGRLHERAAATDDVHRAIDVDTPAIAAAATSPML